MHQGGTVDHEADTKTCETCDSMETDCVNLEASSEAVVKYLQDYKAAFTAHPGNCPCGKPTSLGIMTGVTKMIDHAIDTLKRGQRKQ